MMNMEAARSIGGNRLERVRFARGVLKHEADAIASLSDQLGAAFCQATDKVLACRGSIVVTGMGKAGLVGRKISATFSSTGAPSHFLHPAEAIHGDLGVIREQDLVLALSFSGETEEIVRLANSLWQSDTEMIAMTGRVDSSLAKRSQLTLPLGELTEACHLNLAPSTSTTAMLALGDALALTVSRERGFQRTDFARFHPGGSLGRRLAKVDQWMRPLEQCRLAPDSLTVREVLSREPQPGRRTGAILLLNEGQRLTGVFTDSDLARMISQKEWDRLDEPIRDVMTRAPKTIASGELLEDAVSLLDRHKISELPVLDDSGRPLGLLDITDVLSLSSQAIDSGSGRVVEDVGEPAPMTLSLLDPTTNQEAADSKPKKTMP